MNTWSAFCVRLKAFTATAGEVKEADFDRMLLKVSVIPASRSVLELTSCQRPSLRSAASFSICFWFSFCILYRMV